MKKKSGVPLHIVVINGPNLNLLGEREPQIYGKKSLKEIEHWTKAKLVDEDKLSIKMDWFQYNSEEKILVHLHRLKKDKTLSALIINPAGLSHTSVILTDALLALAPLPIAEVHLSNPYQREEFRRQMLTARAATIIMGGLGHHVYYCAAKALLAQSK